MSLHKSARYLLMSSALIGTLVWLSACGEQKTKERPARAPLTNTRNPGQTDVQVTQTGTGATYVKTPKFDLTIDGVEITERLTNFDSEIPIVVVTSGTFTRTIGSGTPEAYTISTSHTDVGAEVINEGLTLQNNNFISYMAKCTGINCETYYMSLIVVTTEANGNLSEVRQYGIRKVKGQEGFYTYKNPTNVSQHIDELIPTMDESFAMESAGP